MGISGCEPAIFFSLDIRSQVEKSSDLRQLFTELRRETAATTQPLFQTWIQNRSPMVKIQIDFSSLR